MMQEYNTDPAPAVVGNEEVEDNKKEGKNFIDTVCDPCGLVPDNLEQALAHKKKMKLIKAQEEAAVNAEAVIEAPEEEKDATDDDTAVESILSNFNIDCCGKVPAAGDEIEVQEFPAEKSLDNEENLDAERMKNGESASVMTGNNSQQTRSLADIAAKMDEIDLETAAEDTAGDQISEDGGNSIQKPSKIMEWYKRPLYAGLIILCGLFSISIIVMAILLITNKN